MPKDFVVGLDLDGVVFKYSEGLWAALGAQQGNDPTEHLANYEAPTDYAMSKWFADREAFTVAHTTAVDAGLYSNLEVMEGASDALWKLSNEGTFIRIITSRFVKNGQHGQVVKTTGESLDKASIPFREILFMKYKWDVACDVFIDDSPDNIRELRAAGREVIIFDAPYNKGIEGRRAHDWDEAYAHVSELQAIRSYL